MKTIAVIPARMAASRFPGKPLALLAGKPMIEHVYRRAKQCDALTEVYIATCDDAIAKAAKAFGAPVVMTADTHERASDRVAEALGTLDAEACVMVQGDEPMIRPEMISLALEPLLKDPKVGSVNLAAPIRTEAEFVDRNTIKVVMAKNGDALFMSREPIPTRARLKFGQFPAFKQVCVMPFRREYLLKMAKLPPTPLEIAESIDMLRALEHGMPVRMVVCDKTTHAVDTPEDLKKVEALLAA